MRMSEKRTTEIRRKQGPGVGTVDSGNSKRLNSKQSLISKHFW